MLIEITASVQGDSTHVYQREDGTYLIITESAIRAQNRKLGRLYKPGRNVTDLASAQKKKLPDAHS